MPSRITTLSAVLCGIVCVAAQACTAGTAKEIGGNVCLNLNPEAPVTYSYRGV